MPYVLLIFLALLSVSGVGAQEELPPYIHYFDHLRGGLVIERADGTDSRMIPDVPQGNLEWSPSGQWMVIGSSLVVRSDDSLRMPVPQPPNYYLYDRYALWSPTDDLLLTVYPDLVTHLIRMQIFDVDTNRLRTEFTYREMYSDIQGPALHWASDGETAYVAWNGRVVTLSIDGKTELYADEFAQFFEFESAFYKGRRLTFSLQTSEVRVLMIEDLQTGTRIEINDTTSERQAWDYLIRWSPTLDHALMYARPCSDNACEGWLKFIDWNAGTAQSVVLTIELDGDCYDHTCAELWSPDGRYAVLTDKKGAVHLLDAHTGKFRQISTDKTVTDYQWLPRSQLFLNYEDETPLYERIHIYDPATDHIQDVELPVGALQHGIIGPSSFYPSIDEKYIALRNETPTIIDQTGAIVAHTIRHSHSTFSYPFPNGYAWHSGSKWLTANYVISFAGGGNGPVASVLFDVDGTTRRELPTRSGAEFVPDQVIPHLAPGQSASVKKDPILILPQKGTVDGVGWHPSDPDQLVTHSYEDGLIFWSLAGSQPEITEQEIPAFPFPNLMPVGRRLFWLPERDVVAFWNDRAMITLNQKTGEPVTVEGIDYPLIEAKDQKLTIRCSESNRVLQFETLPNLISCGQTGLLYSAPLPDSPFIYLNVDAQVITRLDTGGRYIYAADARNNIAVVGGIHDCCFAVASTETGALLDEFHGTAYSLAISADGRRLATTSAGMTAIWDISEYLPTE